MRRLTMLLVLVAALVLASTGAVLAQNATHKHPTQQDATQQNTTPAGDTVQEGASGPAKLDTKPTRGAQAFLDSSGNLDPSKDKQSSQAAASSTLFGPYTLDPQSGRTDEVGGNNGHYVYGYTVPPHDVVVFVFKYNVNTGQESYVGNLLMNRYPNSKNDGSYYIVDQIIGPLKPLAGTGYYTERLVDYTAGGPITDPHFIYVY